MRILITNDDGIMAPGILALAGRLKELGRIMLIAPREERSATGHGITICDPIRIKKMTVPGADEAWAISGMPADCVKLGIQELLEDGCDLVLSGINDGPNLGTDVLYSGTVSAALEGSILGVPSMALSLASYDSSDFKTASEIAYLLVKKLAERKDAIPRETLLNINIPAVDISEIKGFKVTRLGMREYKNVFDKRIDPRGEVYYWLRGEVVPHREKDPDIDVVAVEQKYVSITPIHFDLTNHSIINHIKSCGFEEILMPGKK